MLTKEDLIKEIENVLNIKVETSKVANMQLVKPSDCKVIIKCLLEKIKELEEE